MMAEALVEAGIIKAQQKRRGFSLCIPNVREDATPFVESLLKAYATGYAHWAAFLLQL